MSRPIPLARPVFRTRIDIDSVLDSVEPPGEGSFLDERGDHHWSMVRPPAAEAPFTNTE